MKRINASPKVISIGLVLFVILFVFFTYAFLHEMGHAIIGLLLGQSLTEFNVSFWNFGAHVGMTGGRLTQNQLAIQSAAGVSLPLLIWGIFISLVPRKANFSLEILKLISSMAVVNTLLAWIVLPIFFINGNAPSDDVTNFLRYSQMSPLLLIFTAIILYVVGWIFFISKIDGLQNEFRLFRKANHNMVIIGARKTITVIADVMIVALVFAVALNTSALRNSSKKFLPPQDFQSVAKIDLSARAYSAETLTEFSLEKSTYVGVFIAVQNINTTYFDLSVTGPNEFHSVVLHGEGYNAFQDGGLWEKNLSAGTYQLVLTSHQSPGLASVYLKTH